MKIKVAITDDHPGMLNGLRSMLQPYGHIEVTAAYERGAALLEGLKKKQPDVLLLDVQLPDITGDELTAIISRQYPEIRILILTSHDDIYYIKTLLRNGAKGYILKTSGQDFLVQAVETVYRGKPFYSPEVQEQLVQETLQLRPPAPAHNVTPREKEILQLIYEEYTSQEIADRLHISHRTVENYRLGLMQKLDSKNMIGMMKKALQLGLVK